MKLRKINFVATLLLGAVIAITGCSKDDGAIKKKIGIEEVPAVTTNIDATGSQAIDLLNLASFQGKFKVDLYFPGSTPPNKVDIVVRKNGVASSAKVFKAGVTTFPSTFTITAAEIATLFGAPIALGDNYDFAPNLYVGDKVYEAFPATGIGTGAGVNGMPGFGEFARFAAICAYDPSIYEGNFKAKDAWGDADGATIVLTKVSNNSFSFIYPSVLNPKPVTVTVNTGNNNISIAGTPLNIGTQWSPAYGYPNTATYANPSINSVTGSVAPCDKTVTLNIQWGTNNGALQFSGGPYKLVLTKM